MAIDFETIETSEQEFYAELKRIADTDVWFRDVTLQTLSMDGRFSLDQLKRIVAAWEQHNEATKEPSK